MAMRWSFPKKPITNPREKCRRRNPRRFFRCACRIFAQRTDLTAFRNDRTANHTVFFREHKNLVHRITCFFLFECKRTVIGMAHGTSTPPTVCRSPTHGLRRFERSDCGCRGVSLLCVLLLSCLAPLDSDRSLKRGRGASTGTAHTECIRLLYAALDFRAFFFKVQK